MTLRPLNAKHIPPNIDFRPCVYLHSSAGREKTHETKPTSRQKNLARHKNCINFCCVIGLSLSLSPHMQEDSFWRLPSSPIRSLSILIPPIVFPFSLFSSVVRAARAAALLLVSFRVDDALALPREREREKERDSPRLLCREGAPHHNTRKVFLDGFSPSSKTRRERERERILGR